MKLHRFIGNYNVAGQHVVINDAEVVKQIRGVLRLAVGEQVVVCDGNGNEAVCDIAEIGASVVKLNVVERRAAVGEPGAHVALYCAVLKRENFEWVVQKATEIGVKEIVPIITRRTVKLNLNGERLAKIAKEAAEQSGRGVVPAIHEPQHFVQLVERVRGKGANILFDGSGANLDASRYALDPIGIWVGPEGGFDPAEVEAARIAGFTIASLGKLTLRAETAAIIASYLVIK